MSQLSTPHISQSFQSLPQNSLLQLQSLQNIELIRTLEKVKQDYKLIQHENALRNSAMLVESIRESVMPRETKMRMSG